MLTGVPNVRTVLMTADALGGVWTFTIDLAAALADAGIRTVLATLGPPPSEAQRDAALAVTGLTLEVGQFRLEWMEANEQEVAHAGVWLTGLARAHQPDVIHLNGFVHGTLPFDAPVLVVAHSCIGTWWRAVHGAAPPARYDGYLARVRQGLRAADAVVAPSRAYLDDLERLYGPLPTATVIPNGRNPAGFGPEQKRDMVFSAGRVWDEAKNVMALDRIAADLDWPVVVAGDWRPPDGSAAPPENLLCLDLVEPERLRQWFGEAAIFALPARYEPFGLAALEAALSGCALVLGDLPTLREVWADAACYVPPDDPDALRSALQELIRNPACRQEMAERARSRANGFTAERMAHRYFEVYRQLVRQRRAGEGCAAAPAAVTG